MKYREEHDSLGTVLFPERKASLTVFALLFSCAAMVGRHMHITSPYAGLMTENYFTPFRISDIPIFILIYALSWIAFALLHRMTIKIQGMPICRKKEGRIGSFLWIVPVLLFMWMPYLLKYWPGFVFDDTLNSLKQAVGSIPLDNRNPLLYTLFIRFCVFCTGGFQTHDLTAACAMYTICQMLYSAICLSYMIQALTLRTKTVWKLILILFYGLSPYIAALNVAMWKDPVFCSSVVALSVLLYRHTVSVGEEAHSKRWVFPFVGLSLIILFWRNNGFCALIGILLFAFIALLRNRKSPAQRRLPARFCALCIGLLILWGIVLVPGYRLFGVGTPKEEISGTMLNQLARAAAYDGELSEEESEYLNSLLPLELYPEVYRPCCVDLFKWDSHFNYDALKGGQFLNTWVSVGLKNPRLYLEAWALESYGFWTVNRPEINGGTANISYGGTPFNLHGSDLEFENYTIRFRSMFSSETKLFPYDSWSIPLGLINWGLVFILISLCLRRKYSYLMVLAPQIGISAGLILQTPIYYLPRYGASAQLLIPLYLMIFFYPYIDSNYQQENLCN